MKSISIVVATYNRPELLNRLLKSIKEQNISVEVIVVDDASTIDYLLATQLPITYLKQKNNQGPGVCRNIGISKAQGDWVVIMDDDDYFEKYTLEKICQHITKHKFLEKYPLFQLPRSNGEITSDYKLINMVDYINKQISGDFLPIINRKLFLEKLYQYPTNRVGGEHLLWWQIAIDYSIPTWSKPMICVLGIEAEVRLTSPSTQIKRASEHMLLAQETLQKFGDILKKDFPSQYLSRLMALMTYALLSGHKNIAQQTLVMLKPYKKQYFLFKVLLLLPRFLILKLFTKYRQASLQRVD